MPIEGKKVAREVADVQIAAQVGLGRVGWALPPCDPKNLPGVAAAPAGSHPQMVQMTLEGCPSFRDPQLKLDPKPVSPAQLLYAKKLAQGKGLTR